MARHGTLSSLQTGLACRCPRCGRGPLYDGYLRLRSACPACGLDYGPADSGDGPAVFIILVLGGVVVALALIVEAKFAPPYWVHLAIWPPLILGGALALLGPLKAVMIAQQFRLRAGEAGHFRD